MAMECEKWKLKHMANVSDLYHAKSCFLRHFYYATEIATTILLELLTALLEYFDLYL